jgi:hypothetical protein
MKSKIKCRREDDFEVKKKYGICRNKVALLYMSLNHNFEKGKTRGMELNTPVMK